MNPNTLAIGLFLFGSGLTLGLSALVLGLTLFRDDSRQPSGEQDPHRFWLERWVRTQKPEYQRFSYLVISSAMLLCLAGSVWMLYQSAYAA
jgi:hypothetical protein